MYSSIFVNFLIYVHICSSQIVFPSNSSCVYHTAFFQTHLYQDRFTQQNQLHLSLLFTGANLSVILSILYVKVYYCGLLKPPLNLSCRPVMLYFISSHPTETLW